MPLILPSPILLKTHWKSLCLYLLVLLISIVFIIWRFNTLQQQRLEDQLRHQGEHIETALTETTAYTENVLRYIAYDITQNHTFDKLERLYASFDSFKKDSRLEKTISWPGVNWANAEHWVVVNAREGILDDPFDLSSRDYIPQTIDHPGTLQMGRAVIGGASKAWILPAGFGVNTRTGEYAGALVMGFDVEKCAMILRPYVVMQGVQAALLDASLQPVVHINTTMPSISQTAPFMSWLKSIDFTRNTPISHTEHAFLRLSKTIYLYKLQNQPYILLLSTDRRLAFSDIAHIIQDNASEYVLTLLSIVALFYFFHRARRMKPSLSQEYFVFGVVTTGLATIILIWLFASFYTYQEEDKKYRYSFEAEKIVNSLSEQFNYVENLARFIGEKISVLKKQDAYSVASILGRNLTTLPQQQEVFSWSLFDFIDTKGNVIASASQGVLPLPHPVTDRSYMEEAPKRPWKLYLSEPAQGITSGEFVIPAGIAITSQNSHAYIGMLSMGFNINRLARKLESVLASETTQFVILDAHNDNIILQSSGNIQDPDRSFFAGKLDYIKTTAADTGILPTAIIYHGISYRYFRTTYRYPYTILIGESTHDLEHTFRTELLPRLIEFVGMWIFILVLLFFFRLKIVAPLISLSDAAKAISEGRTDVKIPHLASVETGQLARSILHVKRAFLREARLKTALQKAKNAAEAANAAKTDFLSATAHELRSPLNAIIGFSDMIKHKLYGQEIDKYVEYADDIQQSGYELLEFITDLLDVNKSEVGYFGLEKEEWVDVTNIIQRSIKLNINKAHQANILIHTAIEDNLPRLYADSRRIRQILINLISNSIRYSPNDTIITISALMQKGKLHLVVADQGFGMNDAQLTKALTPGQTAHHETLGTLDSYGLGLPMTKQLVELHSGQFHIESQVGKGTIITIIFPQERVEK